MRPLISLLYPVRTALQSGRLLLALIGFILLEMSLVLGMQIWVVIPRRVAMAEYWYWRVRVLLGFGATLDRPVLISVNQQSLQSSLGTLLHAPFIEQGHRSFWQHLTPALVLAVTIGGLTAGLVFPLAWRLSAVTLRDRYVRGAQIVTPLQLAQRMHQPKSDPRPLRSPLLLGGHDVLHPHFERQHVRIEGTTGSGKSVLIREFLSWIRAQGDRAIIYDKGCSFVGQFYQPDTDTLLNPFDARSVNWDLWCDATHAADFDHQASALIPVPPNGDPFWNESARSVFASVAHKLSTQGSLPTTGRLLSLLTSSDLSTLSTLLAGTEAATYVSKDIKKTALSIQTVLTTYVRSLRCLQGLDAPNRPVHLTRRFSIANWVRQDHGDGFLFFTSHARHHVALRPLISLWLAIASNAILGLTESQERRVWVILDELPSLQRLPELASTLAEARKFGGCFVASLQSHAQLVKNYGPHDAQAICDLLNSRFFFRSPSHAMAKAASHELGDQDVDIVRESQTLSSRPKRDSRSRTPQRLTRPVVTASDIQALPDLHCFVRSPGTDWITKLILPYVPPETTQPDFIPRDPPPDEAAPDTQPTSAPDAPSLNTLGDLYD
uniref:type IV conjugative transfer system coupling protein TraD n=2 Tax=unclassified Vibrio TaxID=2614977 RepID=UPI001F39E17A|nr:type IV conjugative transfer system coupling protein TraD [Vibrio sp.]QXL80319.1 type IV conjugative transfer system coupling protein TraD [Vibrio sp.]